MRIREGMIATESALAAYPSLLDSRSQSKFSVCSEGKTCPPGRHVQVEISVQRIMLAGRTAQQLIDLR
jgi:hypothetical protein